MGSNAVTWLAGVRPRTLRVAVPPAEVGARLRAGLDPDPPMGERWGYRMGRRHRFHGEATPAAFRVRRWAGGQRPDGPVLLGTVGADGSGAVVSFRVRPPALSLAFLALLTAGWAAFWLIFPPTHVHPLGVDLGAPAVRAGLLALQPVLGAGFWHGFRREAAALAAYPADRLADVRR